MMGMELSLITNDCELAGQAQAAGVERILIDLERLGKHQRQLGRKTFLSDHCIEDIAPIRQVLSRSKLMVRVDPLHPGSRDQINTVLEAGAEIVMLPYFHYLHQAQTFVELVADRAAIVLLVETHEATEIFADLTRLPGRIEFHIGLNDLSISFGRPFLFDLIADGTIAELCQTLRGSGRPFGFGGIAALQRRDLPVPAELILAEQVCQGATRGWLGRSFRDQQPSTLQQSINDLRQAISYWHSAGSAEQAQMRRSLMKSITQQSDQIIASEPEDDTTRRSADPVR